MKVVLPVLPTQQYVSLMDQLRVFLGPFRQGKADSRLVGRLVCMYGYVQAAVKGGDVSKVLSAISSLLGVDCCC